MRLDSVKKSFRLSSIPRCSYRRHDKRRVPVDVQHFEQQQHRRTRVRLIAVGTGRPELKSKTLNSALLNEFKHVIVSLPLCRSFTRPSRASVRRINISSMPVLRADNVMRMSVFSCSSIEDDACIAKEVSQILKKLWYRRIGMLNQHFQHASSEAGQRDAYASRPATHALPWTQCKRDNSQQLTSADQENVVSCCKRGRTFQQPLRDIGNSERPPEAALKEWASLYCNSRFDVDLWPRIDSQKCDTRRIANEQHFALTLMGVCVDCGLRCRVFNGLIVANAFCIACQAADGCRSSFAPGIFAGIRNKINTHPVQTAFPTLAGNVIHVRVGRNLADVKLRINLLESQLRLQYRDRGKHP
ncbi:hypothetical protein T4C_5478 [Trichinella pseudospiralis]|nr:hypothetical protein T4C_5478 [Trichinella pseudospiralis]